MTRNKFIKAYCERSKIEWSELGKYFVAMPCNCQDDECEGWAMVSRDVDAIDRHIEMYYRVGDE